MQKRKTSNNAYPIWFIFPFFCLMMLVVDGNTQSTRGEVRDEGERELNQSPGGGAEIPADEPTVAPAPNADNERGDEAYSQQDDGEQEAEDVSSGIPSGLTLGIIIGMLILIGIIFVAARKSGKTKRR